MFKKFAILAVVAGIGATAAFAQMTADDNIRARQAAMKQQGKSTFGVMAKMFKGEAPFDAAAVKAELDAMGAAYGAFEAAGGWKAEFATGTIETWAKPEIWSDPEGFKAVGAAMGAAWGPLAAAQDEAAFKAAFPAFANGCKGCHEKFRRPKEG